jgi:signal transduction histidine kinase
MTRNGSTRSPGIGVTDRRTGDSQPPPDVDPRLLAAALRLAGPMYIADRGGRLLVTNPAFDDLMAAGTREAPASSTDVAPSALTGIFRRLESGDDDVAWEETIGANGTRRRFRSHHHRIVDADGGIAFAGHYVEVSPDGDNPGSNDYKSDSRQPVTVSQAATAAKNAFLGKMSHEMRTPLNAIIGFAEMSESQPYGPLDQRYVAYLRDIGNAARHLSGMIGDLLELSSGFAEPLPGGDGVVALAQLLAETSEAVSDLAARRGIDLGAVGTRDDWYVAADRDRLHRICVNLLDNAVKFTEPGGRVGVEIEVADEPGMLDIVFWDTGIGIAADRLDRIFESFQQVDPNTLHQPTNGAGLGLAVARHLARQMNGDIRVDSAFGEGARFTLRLPAAVAE